ncbi:hypothetical protein HYR99_21135 [Candidatus Poribacteria bacterium]|nr:hypothetical protein [Candidatus Poribacteria bacterium]
MERTNIPAAATLLGKSVIREDHPLYLGIYEGAMGREDVSQFVENSDCVIILGAFMTDTNLGLYTAHLDRGRSIYATSEKISIKYHTYEDGTFGDFLDSLLAATIRKRQPPVLDWLKPPPESVTVQPDAPMTVRRLFERLNEFITDDMIVITDIGNSLFGAVDLWFGTDGGGVSRFDVGRNAILTYTTGDGLADNRVWAIGEDQRGHLWFGSSGRVVSRYDGKKFVKYTEKDGFGGRWVMAIHRDRQGNLWVGSMNGVSRYDGKTFVNYTTQDGLAKNRVWGIGEDTQGNLWLGTENGGVSRFDGKEFTTYTTKDGLGVNTVQAIHEDQNGFLWFATRGGGVSCYDGKKFATYPISDGLASDTVTAIHEDQGGHLWFGTGSGGVVHYDGVAFQSLDTRDGLIGDLVSSIDQDTDGTLWFATDKGATRYGRNTLPPHVKIVAVTTDQRYIDLSTLKSFTSGSRVTIEYTSIDLKTHTDKRLYRYQMKGYDTNWEKPTKQTSVDYLDLKPGKYTFEVQAIDRDLNYSEPATLTLHVKRPWWVFVLWGTIGIIVPIAVAGFYFGKRLQTQRAIAQQFNPYIAGRVVGSDLFYGRSDILTDIERTLANNCCSTASGASARPVCNTNLKNACQTPMTRPTSSSPPTSTCKALLKRISSAPLRRALSNIVGARFPHPHRARGPRPHRRCALTKPVTATPTAISPATCEPSSIT